MSYLMGKFKVFLEHGIGPDGTMQSDLARESQYSHKADDSYTTFFAETDAKVSFWFKLFILIQMC